MAGYIGTQAVSVNTTSATITGDASIGGNVTLNDGSADVDFRVESNGNANMLLVDGGDDQVRIGRSADVDGFNLVVGTTTAAGAIAVVGRADDISQVIFYEADASTTIGKIDARNSLFNIGAVANVPVGIVVNNSQMATFGANHLTIGDGNLIIGTGGHGIDFAATGDISGTGSELLDDYETGTFQPSVTFGGASSGVQYVSNRRFGIYTKIGNVVTYFVHVELTNKGSSTGGANITGMPFTATNANGNQNYVPGSSFISSMASLSSNLMIRSLSGTTNLDIYQINSSHTYSSVTNANFTNTTGMQVSGVYFV